MIRQSQVAVDKVLPELEKQIKVEDAEVKAYYESHKTDYEEVKASHILISTNPPTPPPPPPADPKDPKAKEAKPAETPKALTKEEARKKAEDLLKQIQGGADFAKLAGENSDDPGSKTQGGDLGFFKKGQMVPAFDKVAFSLKPGEMAPTVVETQFGFHIIKVVERRVPPIDKPMEKEIQDTVKQKQIEKLLDRIAEDNRISVAADFTFPKGEEAPEMGMPPGHP
ncbi:MAG: peptidyl-prolyl cis-trans isomerase [Blastocatellia bacterium]|nr:peptidyl-prolyl cis-trans isomerase [Blastocatellia bacterium]